MKYILKHRKKAMLLAAGVAFLLFRLQANSPAHWAAAKQFVWTFQQDQMVMLYEGILGYALACLITLVLLRRRSKRADEEWGTEHTNIISFPRARILTR